MDELREKVIEALNPGRAFAAYRKVDEETADRILAIPEIAEALKMRDEFLAPGSVVERMKETEARIQETRDSIKRGARRTDHRFNLGPSISTNRRDPV